MEVLKLGTVGGGGERDWLSRSKICKKEEL